MNIDDYHQIKDSKLSFTRRQASLFAKKVAGDFNPIHDEDSKRFCVPGDLLFSTIIHHYGLRERMIFNFAGMVGDNVRLVLPECDSDHVAILDENDKKYVAIECGGSYTGDAQLIESLTTKYVAFSGQAFPHILVDEYQDTNPAQVQTLNLLLNGSDEYGSFWICGDDWQSIYGFTGATIENILNFSADHPGSKQFILDTNYRSTPQILEACRNLIRNNSTKIEKKLLSNKPDGDGVVVFGAVDEEDEVRKVVIEIKDLINGKPPIRDVDESESSDGGTASAVPTTGKGKRGDEGESDPGMEPQPQS